MARIDLGGGYEWDEERRTVLTLALDKSRALEAAARTIADLRAERDEALRERDEAKAEVERHAETPAEPEWDPAGDEPPPVMLPRGLEWQRCCSYPTDWNVQGPRGEPLGFVSPLGDLWWSALVRGTDTHHATALEAARALAGALRGGAA